jgi:protein-S-isoprenylcysteine O-methyltransferase Ste14
MNFAASSASNESTFFSWINWERVCNFLLALMFLRFVLLNLSDLSATLRLSSLLMLTKVSADTLFYLTRKPAQQISTSLYDWVIGIFGAWTNFFFVSTAGTDSWLATAIQITGLSLQVAGIFSLNRSIGFVPANRGIRTTGMYQFVRHPLYFAYTVSFLGYLLNHFTQHNLVVYGVMIGMFILRIIAEERLLSRTPEYREYMQKVPFRLIPGLV